MKEYLELRVKEEHAAGLFAAGEGVALGLGIMGIRKVVLDTSDPRLPVIRERQRALHRSGDALFFGWDYRRTYSAAERRRARLFWLGITSTFEPAGEECGTEYDEASACPVCRAGRSQTSPLRLRRERLPKRRDLARSIADEWIVSERFARAFRDAGCTGATFAPVEFPRRRGSAAAADAPAWYQLVPSAPPLSLSARTVCGVGPFPDPDEDARYRCPRGDTVGLNVLSEIHVEAADPPMADVSVTREHVGVRAGLLVPRPLLLVSPRLCALLAAEGMLGWRIEVAHLEAPICAG